MFKIIEFVFLGFAIAGIYGAGFFLTREVMMLQEVRTDIDMQLEEIRLLTGERRRADIEIE